MVGKSNKVLFGFAHHYLFSFRFQKQVLTTYDWQIEDIMFFFQFAHHRLLGIVFENETKQRMVGKFKHMF